MKKLNKLAALLTLICFSGCGNTLAAENQTAAAEPTTAITTEKTTVTEPEVSYMEKIKDKLAEMPPEEILAGR